MSKETKIIIFAIITMAMNILAPILMINLYKDYTAESFIIGSPDKSVVITEYVEPKDYLYQENLSSLTFVQEGDYWVASYNFEEREFDIEKTYAIFVNDYICTPVDVLGSKVSGTHTIKFNDINKNILDTTKMSIDFEFYTTYSSILLKVETEDITYFNGFKQNPGFILTLTEIDPNLLEIVKNTTITITPEEPDENVVAVTFKSYDDSVLNTYYVEVGDTLSTTPDEPTRAGYVFQGWTLDGINIVDDLSTLTFSENTTFTAVFEEITVVSLSFSESLYSGLPAGSHGECIWTDGTNIYYSYSSLQYVLDKASLSFNKKAWSGLIYFYGDKIWTDGINYYYSNGTEQYVLNKDTSTWIEKTWYGLSSLSAETFSAKYIWTDGTSIYYSCAAEQYVLNKDTSTWIEKTCNVESLGNCIWTDGINYYYSNGTEQYILDVETSTWIATSWIGLTSFYGMNVWSDGEKIYYSYESDQYVLDVKNHCWKAMSTDGYQITGTYVWTDGTNYCYSNGTEQYVILFSYKDYTVTVNLGGATFVSCSNDYTVDDDGNIVCRAGSSIIVTWDNPDFIVWSYTGANCTIDVYDNDDGLDNAYIVFVGGLGNSAEITWSDTMPSIKEDDFNNMTGLV